MKQKVNFCDSAEFELNNYNRLFLPTNVTVFTECLSDCFDHNFCYCYCHLNHRCVLFCSTVAHLHVIGVVELPI